jgi:predicted nucleotidyltransferase
MDTAEIIVRMSKKYAPGHCLFMTQIGSHIWKMAVPGSDNDIFMCYQLPTSYILASDRTTGRSFFETFDDTDVHASEIATVIHQLIKNNLNYIVSVMSPITLEDSPILTQLRNFVPRALSQDLFYSFHGMAIHNLKKYETLWGDDIGVRKLNKIARVLQMGIALLNGEPEWFAPYEGATKQTIEHMVTQIKAAKEHSPLPEHCPIKEQMLDWLVALRLAVV